MPILPNVLGISALQVVDGRASTAHTAQARCKPLASERDGAAAFILVQRMSAYAARGGARRGSDRVKTEVSFEVHRRVEKFSRSVANCNE